MDGYLCCGVVVLEASIMMGDRGNEETEWVRALISVKHYLLVYTIDPNIHVAWRVGGGCTNKSVGVCSVLGRIKELWLSSDTPLS